jgi:circadian clock protein KaiC
LAASFAAAACAASRKALFISFDESGAQIVSNMRSIGLELQPDIDAGRLQFKSLISGRRSPEAYLAEIRAWMDSFAPDVQIIDPISALMNGEFPFSHFICAGLMNYAKSKGVTVLCTSLLSHADGAQELSASQISTIADTWMHVSNVIRDGERNRALTIIKSRGAAHSNQVRELILSHHGIELMDAYVVEGEVLMGSARAQKEAEIMRGETRRDLEARLRRMDLERQIDVLAQAVRSAEAALELKTRESEAVRSAEETLWQSRQAEIAQRRGRRSGDRAERSDSNGAGIA